MRILHLIASNFAGGPEKQILYHAQDLRSAGHEILLGSFHDAAGQGGLVLSPEMSAATERTAPEAPGTVGREAVAVAPHGETQPEVLRLAAAQGHRTVCLTGGLTLRSVIELRRYLRAYEIDLLCTHGYKANTIGYFATRGSAVPQIGFVRGWTAETRRVAFYEVLDRWVLARTDAVVCVSPQQAATLAPRRGRRTPPRVIRNASLPPYGSGGAGARAPLDLPSGAFVLGAAGRLSVEKGHRDLLAAFAVLHRSHPEALLLLLGEGHEEAALRRQAAELGIATAVKFLGFQRDCGAYMRQFDCLVQPSHTEGTPNTILEALMLRVPVVATAVGGVPDLIRNEVNGLLVPAHAPEALAAALQRLLRDPALRERLASAGAEMGEEFAPATQRRKLLELYQAVARPPSVAGHRAHAAGGEIAGGPREEMPTKFRRAARRREREIGSGGLLLSPEMSAATERSASGTVGSAGLPAVAAAPLPAGAVAEPLPAAPLGPPGRTGRS